MSIEGVDFSAHPPGHPGSAALKAAGKFFVCTYLARATDWRVLSVPELNELIAGGIEIVANYEADTETWRGGFQTGVDHALYAQENLIRVGLPATMPIYFSVDYDASPEDQAVIDDYLHGCASVVGLDRVGVYGGFYVVRRCFENGSARWLWQTSAWSGGQWYQGNHIEQYAYNHDINGVECDDNRAVKEHYGQRSDFLAHPTTTTTTTTAAPHPPKPPKLPKGSSLGRVRARYNPLGIKNPRTGEVAVFTMIGNASRVWLRHVLDSNPDGKHDADFEWPALASITRLGDGRQSWQWSDGFVWNQDAP